VKTGGEYSAHNDTEPMLPTNTRLLVAIGAAVCMNCQLCLEHLIPSAFAHGIESEEITEVVTLATEVRENALRFTLAIVARLKGPEAAEWREQVCCRPGHSSPTDRADPAEAE
jgi:alkylhydroperoxidase/carboxymuconolactone decarboxylase family protein YurZ